ncbi:MAG TPA: hypothetical protein VFA08_09210 [Actinomycetota bacterium]|nr:hypothetical protein [Actinomycetota bacterium]
MMTGPLRKAILRYKYEDVRRWADIFGRVLAGYLDENEAAFKRFDIIAPSPTYVGSGGREWDHTEAIVQVAADESETDWPFQLERPYVIEQVRPTPRFVEQKRWQDRRHLAEGEFRRSLLVPDQDRVSGQSILLIDDVFTDGLRTREVALALQSQGATEVSQVVLARQPYRPKS